MMHDPASDQELAARPEAHAHVQDRYAVLDNLLEGCQVISPERRYLYVNKAGTTHGRRTKEELLGRTMMDLCPGIEHTPLFDVLNRCMEARTVATLENEFTYPDETIGWFELRIEPVPEGLLILSLDITARKRAEQAIQRQVDRLDSLRAIDLAILGTTDFRLALKTVLEETTKRLHVDAAAVFLLKPGSAMLEITATTGFRTGAAERVRTRLGDGVIGRAALERRTIMIPDIAATMSPAGELPAALAAEGIQSFSATPLIARARLTGVLAVAHRVALNASEDWVSFLEALAGQAARAIDAGKSFEELQRAHLELAIAYETTLEGWSTALDLRHKETHDHTLRVAEITVDLARLAGLSEPELVHVRRGALLHDIGQMGTPDAILLKPGPLTAEEWVIMRKHPTHAYDLLSPIAYLRPALDIPYCHHEHWDGDGYPRGLKGEEIPLAARLFAVVDLWDALLSDRPYRSAWPEHRVREHLRAIAGTHLDPKAVELFMAKQAP